MVVAIRKPHSGNSSFSLCRLPLFRRIFHRRQNTMFISQCRSFKPLLNSRLPLLRPFLSKCLDQSFKTMASSGYVEAGVFWDVEVYKIPEGLSAADVSRNIKIALAVMGHRGTVSINAYINATNQEIQDHVFHPAGIELNRIPNESPLGLDHSRRAALFNGMGSWAFVNTGISSTIMLITNDNPILFYPSLKRRNFNVFWNCLSVEGKPIPQTLQTLRRSSEEPC
ncbi:PREDICTED: uncharacterized protein LOC104788580 [Camelina sativa]|uniref:Uncharacterized protein LOC104788580 n=1 Tax=Camelina sativa TaxID=90675 RepID=A0ABM0ZA83_CAMSA|nr:PREDICTED: uncharacterized protein LOC104788580 [Camelina sativa]